MQGRQRNHPATDFGDVLERAQAERHAVAARLEQLDAAIAAMRPLVDGAAIRPAPPRGAKPHAKAAKPAKAAPSSTPGKEPAVSDDTVRAFVSPRGWVRPRALEGEFHLTPHRRRLLMKDLRRRGVIAVSGSGRGMKIALAGKAPAKEVP